MLNSVPNMSVSLSMNPALSRRTNMYPSRHKMLLWPKYYVCFHRHVADIICTLADITCYYGQHIMFVIDILCLFVVLNRT